MAAARAGAARDGSIWFTDPVFGIAAWWEGEPAEAELPQAVYRLAPDGQLQQAISVPSTRCT